MSACDSGSNNGFNDEENSLNIEFTETVAVTYEDMLYFSFNYPGTWHEIEKGFIVDVDLPAGTTYEDEEVKKVEHLLSGSAEWTDVKSYEEFSAIIESIEENIKDYSEIEFLEGGVNDTAGRPSYKIKAMGSANAAESLPKKSRIILNYIFDEEENNINMFVYEAEKEAYSENIAATFFASIEFMTDTDESYFEFESSSHTITGYDENGGLDVVIPEKIDGLQVRKIGINSFREGSLRSVEVPKSVKEIEFSAFFQNDLDTVKLKEGLEVIARSAFGRNSLNSIEIPDTVQIIEGQAFSRNDLDFVYIPDSVERLGYEAFSENNLVEVELPEGLKKIKAGSFGFNELEKVDIPDSVQKIENDAFYGNEITEIDIPCNVETIGHEAFLENDLTKVKLGEDVKLESSSIGGNFKEVYEANDSSPGTYLRDDVDSDWYRMN